MYRFFASLLVFVLLGLATQAQRAVLENTFVTVSAGLNTYVNDKSGFLETTGTHFSGAAGYHINNYSSIRGALVAMTQTTPSGTSGLYLYGHADYLVNITNSIWGYTPNRKFQLNGYYGVGLVHGNGDNEFCLSAGLQAGTRIAPFCTALLDIQSIIHPSGFDNNQGLSFAPMASLGFQFDINENGQYQKERMDNPTPSSDWFVGFGALGLNSFNYRTENTNYKRINYLGPAAELFFGKLINIYWSGRINISGLQARNENRMIVGPDTIMYDNTFTFFNVGGDFMLNLSNLFSSQNYLKRLTFNPYAGAGFMFRTDRLDESHIMVNAGLFTRYIISEHSDIFLDIRYALTDKRFSHVDYKQGSFSVGMASASIGYIHSIGNARCRKVRKFK